ncbi:MULTISPECIES: hypothetical protein [Mesorhizobium]|uniref:hypothetical protein n=1 Tax=Mesorhizobium TaxID=68287 RepID=UPI00398C5594
MRQTQAGGAITGVIARDSNYNALAGKVRIDLNVTDDCRYSVCSATAPLAIPTTTQAGRSPLRVAASTRMERRLGFVGRGHLQVSTRKRR